MSLTLKCSRVLQLSRIKGLGLKRFHQLLEAAGSLDQLLSADPCDLDSGLNTELLKRVRQCLDGKVSDEAIRYQDKVSQWLSSGQQRYVICLDDVDYPMLLKQIYCPPPLLYLQGCLSALEADSMAVVGSRKPTLAGMRHAQRFASELAEAGLVITSGLALGIDAAAHRAALGANGMTMAVLATGLNRIYPRQHAGLATELCDKGLLVSEMPLDTAPLPGNFPRRNRLVSGLSSGVLVIEAGLKSGSLITARFALEQNRDVFAIPGAIDSLASQGCHLLIKEGAALVESVDDILSAFQCHETIREKTGLSTETPALSPDEQVVCRALAIGYHEFDGLLTATGLSTPELMKHLLNLELKQLIAQVPGGYELTKPVNLPA